MQIKNEILVTLHTRPKTVWITSFASLRARGHHLVYLYSFRLYCGQYVMAIAWWLFLKISGHYNGLPIQQVDSTYQTG